MSNFITSEAGVRMPRIIYGTAWKGADTERLVSLAIRQGFRGIDTACQPKHYDEAGVGAGLARCMAEGLARGAGAVAKPEARDFAAADMERCRLSVKTP